MTTRRGVFGFLVGLLAFLPWRSSAAEVAPEPTPEPEADRIWEAIPQELPPPDPEQEARHRQLMEVARAAFDEATGLPVAGRLQGALADRWVTALVVQRPLPDPDDAAAVTAQVAAIARLAGEQVRAWVDAEVAAGHPRIVALLELSPPVAMRIPPRHRNVSERERTDSVELYWDGCGLDDRGQLRTPPRTARLASGEPAMIERGPLL